jgi:hypothetical protein
MKMKLLACVLLGLTGCGGGSGSEDSGGAYNLVWGTLAMPRRFIDPYPSLAACLEAKAKINSQVEPKCEPK